MAETAVASATTNSNNNTENIQQNKQNIGEVTSTKTVGNKTTTTN